MGQYDHVGEDVEVAGYERSLSSEVVLLYRKVPDHLVEFKVDVPISQGREDFARLDGEHRGHASRDILGRQLADHPVRYDFGVALSSK